MYYIHYSRDIQINCKKNGGIRYQCTFTHNWLYCHLNRHRANHVNNYWAFKIKVVPLSGRYQERIANAEKANLILSGTILGLLD